MLYDIDIYVCQRTGTDWDFWLNVLMTQCAHVSISYNSYSITLTQWLLLSSTDYSEKLIVKTLFKTQTPNTITTRTPILCLYIHILSTKFPSISLTKFIPPSTIGLSIRPKIFLVCQDIQLQPTIKMLKRFYQFNSLLPFNPVPSSTDISTGLL